MQRPAPRSTTTHGAVFFWNAKIGDEPQEDHTRQPERPRHRCQQPLAHRMPSWLAVPSTMRCANLWLRQQIHLLGCIPANHHLPKIQVGLFPEPLFAGLYDVNPIARAR